MFFVVITDFSPGKSAGEDMDISSFTFQSSPCAKEKVSVEPHNGFFLDLKRQKLLCQSEQTE